MKKIVALLSIFASMMMVTSCATKSQPAPATDTTTASAPKHHGHDFKGEG